MNNNYNFKDNLSIVEYNLNYPNKDLNTFFDKAKKEKLLNNISFSDIMNKPKSKLFLVYLKSNIIAMSTTHDFSEYYKDTWRVASRIATLQEFKNRGFSHNRVNKIFTGGVSGILSKVIPLQVKYAQLQGAKQFYFTTNKYQTTTNSISSKVDKLLNKVVNIDPRFSFIEIKIIYNTVQSVWKLNSLDLQL